MRRNGFGEEVPQVSRAVRAAYTWSGADAAPGWVVRTWIASPGETVTAGGVPDYIHSVVESPEGAHEVAQVIPRSTPEVICMP